MNKEIKENWVAALRSDDYSQGTLYLCNRGRYCCLGVLADVEGHKYDPNTQLLPGDFLKTVELSEHNAGRLMEMNDDEGMSFEEIADWIEEKL